MRGVWFQIGDIIHACISPTAIASGSLKGTGTISLPLARADAAQVDIILNDLIRKMLLISSNNL